MRVYHLFTCCLENWGNNNKENVKINNMNDAFISIITDYLKDKDTDYALMINGAWGCGKTYFIKNTLKASIESVECPIQKDNGKKKTYMQIFVSLYGVASVEEIKERIFYAINPTFKWLEIVSNKIVSATEAIPTLGSGFKNVLSCNNKEKEKRQIYLFFDI